MTSTHELQTQYIAELRAIAPSIDSWWEDLNSGPRAELAKYRWPTGPGGHPRVLAVFRRYFLLIEELNEELRRRPLGSPPENREEMWGQQSQGEGQQIEKPVDLLINDIPNLAPDVGHLALGIAFVPIGLNEKKEFV